MMFGNLATLIVVGLGVGACTFTITKASIFKPLRDVTAHMPRLGVLLACPYCLSHWLALVAVITYPLRFATIGEAFCAIFAVVAIANLTIAGISYSFLVADAIEEDDSE